MTFYTYMTRYHIDDNTPVGNLARDIKRDKEKFPRNGKGKFNGWRELIYNYLVQQKACNGCLAAFDESWEEYVSCVKKK
ncbi:MAG TPA: YozE family protein [Ruminococcus sp.]|nr:YozE family protein [Ruminococcus sp.]